MMSLISSLVKYVEQEQQTFITLKPEEWEEARRRMISTI